MKVMTKTKYIFLTIFIFIIGITLGFFITPLKNQLVSSSTETELISPAAPTPKPLDKYSFNSLSAYTPASSPLILDEVMFEEPELTAYQGHFETQNKTMSFQLMVPTTATPSAGFPIILMIRGFVDPSIYETGIGTQNAARYFAARGFVTISPDFLGYGTSDDPALDVMEARLEKPAQLLDLIASLPTLRFIDPLRFGIWGHSNGGQIALSLLEITNSPTPTVLWAPVTKPFPYSLLYYTDEYDDGGKALRKVIADFEKDYDVFDFSLDKYIDQLVGPIQLHQGGSDDAVPIEWSNEFVEAVNQTDEPDKEPIIEYFTYEAADHNLRPNWNTVVERSYQFYKDNL